MENAEKALMMAFAVLVLVFALAIAMNLLTKVTSTAEQLTFYADSTRYYDNVELDNSIPIADAEVDAGTVRLVSAETIIPTLYRYYKENFCVKIYDASNELIQIFDVNLEGKVHGAASDSLAGANDDKIIHIENNAYNKVYNNDRTKNYCLFDAPWLGSTESVKTRIDYFVEGKSGYINNSYVDYKDNAFYIARRDKKQFKERFINYSYTGQTFITDDGEELTTGGKSKDKVVIIYTLMN